MKDNINRWITGKIYDFTKYHGKNSAFVRQLTQLRYSGGKPMEFIKTIEGPPEPKDWFNNYALRFLLNGELA